ncbi:MAG: pseudouridine synthase [Rhodospirillales bacterium]
MPRKSGPAADAKPERIAKVMARAGLCSRREAERWIEAGRVAVDGRKLTTPAVTVTESQIVTVDGKPIAAKPETKLWRYHKPAGLIVSHGDPEGRPTVFDRLPPEMPRVVSVGRLDINSEGLLLLTNDGELERLLESPKTAWTRKYRVRVRGRVEPKTLAGLANGVTVSGIRYGPIRAELETAKQKSAANIWISVAIQEGKNREVRKVMEHLGLSVNRLIRVGYGPFQLGNLARGAVEEIGRSALRSSLPKDFKLD